MSDDIAEATTHTYPCGGCGAKLEHAPGTHALRCPYCGHEQAVAPPQRSVREHAFAQLAQSTAQTVPYHPHIFTCRQCGAQTESEDLSQQCPFCSAALVAEVTASEHSDHVAPEAVLPFEVDRAGVREALRQWVSTRRFAPGSLRKVTEAEQLKGTYLPHWTFDARTVSDYRGQRGEHYWVTETYTTTGADGKSSTQTRQVRKTRWYRASGTVRRDFDDVLVTATLRVKVDWLNKLAPWPLDQAVPYRPEYLAGHQTLRYDVEPQTGLAEAQQQMDPVIRSDCKRDIGGDEQRVQHVDTDYSDVTYKLLLLPVWMVAYLHGGRSWQVMINARTGEVIGERPYSKAKIAAAILAGLAVLAVIILFIMYSGDN